MSMVVKQHTLYLGYVYLRLYLRVWSVISCMEGLALFSTGGKDGHVEPAAFIFSRLRYPWLLLLLKYREPPAR